MPSAPPMTRARWVILAAGLPVVLALIAGGVNAWVNRTVIYLADQHDGRLLGRVQRAARPWPGPLVQQQR